MSKGASHTNAKLKAILRAGKLFEGKYRIQRPLGAGSFAVVVHAKHEVMERDVALKLLKPKVVASNPEVSERFVNEVQIASRLRHPNLVEIYDFGVTDDGIYYMVQEYIEGKTVDEVFTAQTEPLARPLIMRMMAQVLSCLGEAHAQGVIHRDLKPSNLMLTRDEEGREMIKILDFGVAKLLEKDDQGVLGGAVRQSTKFIGTPIYMSPEQILGKGLTPSSDLYSAGLMLYEMLTGEPPIDADQIAEVVRLHLADEPFAFPRLPELPPLLQRVILKSTSRQPQDRYPDAKTFAAALRGEEQAPQQPPAAPADPAPAKEPHKDVFSGRHYIDIPEEHDELFDPLPFDSQVRARAEAADAAPSYSSRRPPKKERPPEPKPSEPLGELELDMDVMRSVKKRYTKPKVAGEPSQVRPPPAKPAPAAVPLLQPAAAPVASSQSIPAAPSLLPPLAWGALVALLTAANVFIVGALMTIESSLSTRLLVGLSPLAGALVWWFVEQMVYREEHPIVRGVAIRLGALTGVVLAFCVLIVPGYAAQVLRLESASLLYPGPEDQFGALGLASAKALGALGSISDALARILPWA